MTVGRVFRRVRVRACAAVALPLWAGAMSGVIHRGEIFTGLRRGFGGESLGNSTLELRCRRALPGPCRRRAGRVGPAKLDSCACDSRSMYVQLRARRSTGGGHRLSPTVFTNRLSPIIVGVRHWLIFSFNVRARGPRFQPASRPSGFCSRAFHVSPCHCAVRLVDKCTSGSPMTPGSAPPVNPAMRACSTHPGPRCTPPRAAMAQKRRNSYRMLRRAR